jgi:hypothetical protein
LIVNAALAAWGEASGTDEFEYPYFSRGPSSMRTYPPYGELLIRILELKGSGVLTDP